MADRSQLLTLVTQLVRNAADAIGEGTGEIYLRAGRITLTDEAYVVAPFAGLADSDCAFIEVIDDGGGIRPPDLERVFDPFFTTKPGHRGLGLAVASGVARSHGGVCRIDNVTEGTQARLLLPVAQTLPTRAEATLPLAQTP
jgi:two-component system cell cycle sensor histidine kinase/response regulator CckA